MLIKSFNTTLSSSTPIGLLLDDAEKERAALLMEHGGQLPAKLQEMLAAQQGERGGGEGQRARRAGTGSGGSQAAQQLQKLFAELSAGVERKAAAVHAATSAAEADKLRRHVELFTFS